MEIFGVEMTLEAPGLKNIIDWGNKTNEYTRSTRRVSKRVQQKQR